MVSIHDSDCCSALRARVDKLSTDSPHQWGVMSSAQMLWHLNASMSIGLGKIRAQQVKPPLPLAILRPMALMLPFPKGRAKAIPETVAPEAVDFEAERGRFHDLIEEFSLKPLHFNWLEHPVLGHLSGPSWSRLMAKHTDYHLRQFGV
jgi:hypothetical protein